METDLRQTPYAAALFVDCKFRNAKLIKLDLQGTSFADCVSEGELEDVLFYRRIFKGEALPFNEMANVDCSRAKLRFVEFRGLDLDTVKFPADDEHVVVS